MAASPSESDRTVLRPAPGRVPPHDLEAEGAVLSAVLLSEDAFDRLHEFLSADHFYADANRIIYQTVSDLKAESMPVDIVTIGSYLRERNLLARIGGSPYLAQIIDAVPAVAHVETYAKQIVERWRIRQVIATCQATAAEGYAGVTNVQGYIETAETSLSLLAQQSRQRGLELVADIFGRSLEQINEAYERGGVASGIPTGLHDLDNLTGGWHDGELTILGARPGMGKTSLATTLAAHLSQAEPPMAVPIFSLEMPRDQLALRIACAESGVDLSRVRRNTLSREDLDQLIRVQERLLTMPIWIDDTPAITVLEVRSRIRKLKRELETGIAKLKARLGPVFIDYLQLMKGIRLRNESREQEISSISQGLKNMAKAEQVPVCALSQLNRALESRPVKDRRPQLSDLRESGSLEQDADNVLFIFREGFYDDNVDRSQTELIVSKQRNGPVGKVDLYFQARQTRFVPLERDSNVYDHGEDDQYYEDGKGR